jgi:tetratricopeptide (TPR) repeat protein
VSQSPSKPNETIQAQVERLTTEAKQLTSAGKDAQALDTYRRAAELMPGAPWLQHRTAELARKLKRYEVAARHYRRAGSAFIGAGFPKRALAPYRTAWGLYLAALPQNPTTFVALSLELAELQRALGFPADGKLAIVNANQALSSADCSERVPMVGEFAPRTNEKNEPGSPPESGVKPNTPHVERRILSRFVRR